jgi:cold shock protein
LSSSILVVRRIVMDRRRCHPDYHLEGGRTKCRADGSSFFSTERGYGFIAPDGGGSDVFVHVHEVEVAGMKMLVAGQLVAYEVGPARDGRSKAVNLRLVHRGR